MSYTLKYNVVNSILLHVNIFDMSSMKTTVECMSSTLFEYNVFWRSFPNDCCDVSSPLLDFS